MQDRFAVVFPFTEAGTFTIVKAAGNDRYLKSYETEREAVERALVTQKNSVAMTEPGSYVNSICQARVEKLEEWLQKNAEVAK